MADKKKSHSEASIDLLAEHGLPQDQATEKLILGLALTQPEAFEKLSAILTAEDFTTRAHQLIWGRIVALKEAGEHVDRITLSNALGKHAELEICGGLTGLLELDQGLPDIPDPTAYAKIVLEKSKLRGIIQAAQRAIDQAILGIAPASDIAAGTVSGLEKIQAVQNDREDGRRPITVIEQYPGGVSAFMDPSLREHGLPTGFKKLDEITEGLHPGELIIVGARPGAGKSAFALNLCQHLCLSPRLKKQAALFSLEMNAPSILTRLMCSVARMDQHKFRMGFVHHQERAALQKALFSITESNLIIFDKFGISMSEIERHIRRMTKEGMALAVVDYLQLIASARKAENRNLEVSEMTRRFKVLAGECKVPIILLSQLSRRNEQRPGGNQRPILSDLRDSGSIEQDADSVWFIHREELYKKDRDDIKGLAEIIVAKQRNGPISTVHLRFLGGLTRFENNAEDLPPEEEDSQQSFQEPPPMAPDSKLTEEW